MEVLVPVDGSDCSYRALRFATEFVTRYEGSLDVVHFVEQDADKENEETQRIVDRVETILDEDGISADPSIVTDVWITDYRYANRIGKDIVRRADEEGYDHVVMGHHGMGTVERVILGSAAETVVRESDVPSTIVP